MWAIHRASKSLRNQSCCILLTRSLYAKSGGPNFGYGEHQNSKGEQVNAACHLKWPSACVSFLPAMSSVWARDLSSQVRSKSTDKDDELEDGFSELEDPPDANNSGEHIRMEDDGTVSVEDGDQEDSNDAGEDALGLPETESVYGEKGLGSKSPSSPLFKVIMKASPASLNNALDKWVEEGNPLERGGISLALLNLRKRRFYGKALQFMEWLEATRRLDFVERDYASRLDLVAKVLGIYKAEKYIEKIPQSFRGEIAYRTLLANCVSATNVKKAEEVFNKIRNLGFPLTVFVCNQLLLLYKRVDKKKISDVLKMMEKEDVKPSLFTYRLLIDTKGRINDIPGMEDVIVAMKAEGVEPDHFVQAMIVKYYICAGHNGKAEAALRDMEKGDISNNRAACRSLLPLCASLGKADDVRRIWNVCEHNPSLEECLAAIEAWGNLGNIEEAEKVFEKMMNTWEKLSSWCYDALLKVYANHKLLSKGKELAKRMLDGGRRIRPLTLDALVKLYMVAGEVEKADSILHKISGQNQIRPLYSTYICVMEKYVDRGDIHNAEKMFHRLRQMGYVGRIRQYQLLLQAYINGKTPAYGFRERMKADNIFPNKSVLAQLHAVDASKKTDILELLD